MEAKNNLPRSKITEDNALSWGWFNISSFTEKVVNWLGDFVNVVLEEQRQEEDG